MWSYSYLRIRLSMYVNVDDLLMCKISPCLVTRTYYNIDWTCSSFEYLASSLILQYVKLEKRVTFKPNTVFTFYVKIIVKKMMDPHVQTNKELPITLQSMA